MAATKKILTYLLPVQLVVVQLLTFFPEFVEKYYSNTVYPFISKTFRYIFGWLPFSVGDLFYSLGILLVLRFIYVSLTKKSGQKRELLWSLGATLSVMVFLFYALWGLNYARNNLYTRMELQKNEKSEKALLEYTSLLNEKISALHGQLTTNDTLPVVVPYTKNEIFAMVPEAYIPLSEKFPYLAYSPVSLKKSLLSLPLTYMGFAGYLNPFTGEAQVDYLMPEVALPVTCAHEIAHQIGIGFESEANFIGFLASVHHDDPYIQYSAYIMAYRYALFDLARTNTDLFEEYVEKTPKGIIKNIQEIENFWLRYDNKSEAYFKAFYEGYLRMNNQEDGLRSYSKMTDLLMAYTQKYEL